MSHNCSSREREREVVSREIVVVAEKDVAKREGRGRWRRQHTPGAIHDTVPCAAVSSRVSFTRAIPKSAIFTLFSSLPIYMNAKGESFPKLLAPTSPL